MPLTVTQNIRIAAGDVQEYDNPNLQGVVIDNSDGGAGPVLRNAGTVIVAGSFPIGMGSPVSGGGFDVYGEFINEATGAFLVYGSFRATGFPTIGIQAEVNLRIQNDGLISVLATTLAYGVQTHHGSSALINNGTLRVMGEDAFGVDMVNGGVFNNSGVIDVYGDLFAVGIRYQRPTSAGNFVNSGVIIAQTAYDSPYASIAVWMLNGEDYTNTFDNSGLVAGDYAFRAAENQEGLFSNHLLVKEIINNTGEMYGTVFLAYGDDVVHNSGYISGLVDLYEGDDQYDGVGDLYGATVDGGQGADLIVGGSGSDTFFGDDGADTIRGGAGDDYIEGGRGADTLNGEGGFDTISFFDATQAVTANLSTGVADGEAHDVIQNFERVIGSHFGDTMIGNSSANVLEGYAGNDTLYGGGGSDTLFGDGGDDHLTGGAGDDVFVFNIGDGHDVIEDFDVAAVNERLSILGYAAAQSITQVGADTLITLSASDSILLKNVTASQLGPTELDFQPTASPAPTWRTLQTIVTQDDYVIGAGERFEFVDPAGTGHLNQAYSSAGLLLDNHNGLTNAGTISVTATTTADDDFVVGVATLISNVGITLKDSYNQASGVIRVVSETAAEARGLVIGGNLWNAGLIEVSSVHGDALGFKVEVYPGASVNSGQVTVQAGAAATGAYLRNFRTFHNSGTIQASGHDASLGVRIEGAGAIFINSGTIRVTDQTAGRDSIGVHVGYTQSGLIYNSGLIEGDYALAQDRDYTSTPTVEVVYNTGELRGAVSFGVGEARLYNAGLITGVVELGDDNDIYDGRGGGTVQGAVYGGAGSDILLGGAGAETFYGGQGGDILGGGAGDDVLTGGTGNDAFRFEAGGGYDTITDFTAGGSDDTIFVVGYSSYLSAVQQGADTLVTFSGADSILLRNVTASALTSGDFQFSATALPAFAAIPKTPVNRGAPNVTLPALQSPYLSGDLFQGDAQANSLTGGLGNDYITGDAGDDTLNGSGGDDTIRGGTGADLFIYARGGGNDYLADFNPAEGDTLFLQNYTLGEFSIRALSGLNESQIVLSDGATISFTLRLIDLLLIPGAIQFGTTTPPGVQALLPTLPASPPGPTVTGTSGDDILNGGAGDDYLSGLAGNDVMNGGGGLDIFDGGDGDDTVIASSASEQYFGGFGFDTVSFVNLAQGIDAPNNGSIESFIGSEFNDHLRGTGGALANILEGRGGDDLLTGAGWMDTLRGGDGADVIEGRNAQDTLYGDAGDDILDGGDASDVIYGGDGDDIIIGGGYSDTMSGGAGSDIFVLEFFSGSDEILDFDPLHDKLKLINWHTYDSLEASGADTIVHLGPVTVTLRNVTPGQLTSANFIDAVAVPPVPDFMPGFALGAIGADAIDGASGDDDLYGLAGDDVLAGKAGDDWLDGGPGSDALYGQDGDDILFDGGHGGVRDFLFGGAGNDYYHVHSSYADANEDLVYEGGTNPDIMAGAGDIDTIYSSGDFFWDFYSVGEVLRIDTDAGSLIVGGKDVQDKLIYGGAGNDRIVTYGHNSIVDAGPGADGIDFGPYDLDSSYNGSNTLVMRPGTGLDYVYNFESGVDHIDLSAFGFGITGAQVLAQAVNVDNPGTANDYCYFYLTGAGGTDNFITFMGLLSTQLQASDFIT